MKANICREVEGGKQPFAKTTSQFVEEALRISSGVLYSTYSSKISTSKGPLQALASTRTRATTVRVCPVFNRVSHHAPPPNHGTEF